MKLSKGRNMASGSATRISGKPADVLCCDLVVYKVENGGNSKGRKSCHASCAGFDDS